MPRITLEEAQQWLETTKLTLPALDLELEGTASEVVLSSLAGFYTVSDWTDENTTPDLVRKIIAMLHSAWFYQRQYSEDDELNQYAKNLEAKAYQLLEGITSGDTLLMDVLIPGGGTTNDPVFYPNDDTGEPGSESEGQGIKFSMGTVF